jgi:outer membrane autotransporter protein
VRSMGTLVSGGSARVEATSGSLYGAWFGQNWTFNGIATYGGLTTDLTRVVSYSLSNGTCILPCITDVNGTLAGNPSGRSYAVGVSGGYQARVGSWDVEPSVSVNYRRVNVDSFTESSVAGNAAALAMTFGEQTFESLRSVVGLDLSRAVSVPFGVLTPIVRVEWDHEFKTSAETISTRYEFDPSIPALGSRCYSCFLLPTDPPVANYGIAAVGVSVTLARRIQAFVYDEALFGYNDYHSNAVTLGARAQF